MEGTQRWPGEAGGWPTLGRHYAQGQINEWRNLEDRVDSRKGLMCLADYKLAMVREN